MKFFCMDLHISVIADFKTACPDVEVVDWCLSGHAWVMKRNQDHPEHINPATWKNLNTDMIKKFQDKYDPFLKTFDGFIVGFCSAFAMIYEKYNKPIIMLNAVRYDIPFCWTKDMNMLTKWNECIDRLNSHGLLTIVSNNKADQRYTQLGCGLQPQYIPSLCLYTGIRYNPTKPTFLLYHSKYSIQHPLITMKPSKHEWSDIASYRGIISFPYEVSLMSLFEYFTAGCPFFFPSKSYMKSNPEIQSISAYWGNDMRSYFQELRTADGWIDYADMYDVFRSPNTYYFDSLQHLEQLLTSFQYVDDRAERIRHIDTVKQTWRRVIGSIISKGFWEKAPRHINYNRLPLLANVVYDISYEGTGVSPQHSYPQHYPLTSGDVVFVKTDMLSYVLDNYPINTPITLVTGVSDMSPSQKDCDRILANPNVRKWIGCNITVSHPKIIKMPIGVGEVGRVNGDHTTLQCLHNGRPKWDEKSDAVCIPYHGGTHGSRTLEPTLPKLEFAEYMREIGKFKFVVCQRGNGVDTHRVCEVLLMGSVPVIEHSGLDDMYSQWPMLLVDTFNNIDTTGFQWDDSKYEAFLDVFWLRDMLKDRLL